MRRGIALWVALATPAFADQPKGEMTALEVLDYARTIKAEDIELIEAKHLSVEELLAFAAAEREDPTRLQCCDWGGSCLPHKPGS